ARGSWSGCPGPRRGRRSGRTHRPACSPARRTPAPHSQPSPRHACEAFSLTRSAPPATWVLRPGDRTTPGAYRVGVSVTPSTTPTDLRTTADAAGDARATAVATTTAADDAGTATAPTTDRAADDDAAPTTATGPTDAGRTDDPSTPT